VPNALKEAKKSLSPEKFGGQSGWRNPPRETYFVDARVAA
jgi:hypothetical protein